MGLSQSHVKVTPENIKKDVRSPTIRAGVQQSQQQEMCSRNPSDNKLFQQQHKFARRMPTQTINFK